MEKIKVKTTYKKFLADTSTPVSIYMRLRDQFQNCLLLESSDYHSQENSYSYICFSPVAAFQSIDHQVSISLPGLVERTMDMKDRKQVLHELISFSQRFESEKLPFDFQSNGLFGYMAYDAVQNFEDIDFSENTSFRYEIPDIVYRVYRHIIVINHFKNELYLFEHDYSDGQESQLEKITTLIHSQNTPLYQFSVDTEESSNIADREYVDIVKKGIEHAHRGDVFQIVLSRGFQAGFSGDEFNVYRTLRSINPSPYLFYFDYGSFKIFGSSPEAQIVIREGKASIFPIAGTFKRTGNDVEDLALAEKLKEDVKENSEHVMLVDLARNDLSRNGDQVKVETFKEIQYYSHVIHLVSKVTGLLSSDTHTLQVVADTFPAGTLSGAPKHMAMQLINTYEKTRRGYYGGAIGLMGFDGDFNHAIMIRSFLSKDNTLFFQAGAGVVAKSDPESELQEVNNKVAALRQAIDMAQTINKR